MGLYKNIEGILGIPDYTTGTVKAVTIDTNTGKLSKKDFPVAGSQLDTVEHTIYVSPNFTQTGQFYNDLGDAITYANGRAYDVVIIVYAGTYSGNYVLSNRVQMYCFKEVIIGGASLSSPVLTMQNGAKIFGEGQIGGNPLYTGYEITMAGDNVLEGRNIGADIYTSGGSTIYISGGDVEIRVQESLGIVVMNGALNYIHIYADVIGRIDYTNTANSDSGDKSCYIKTNILNGGVYCRQGDMYIETELIRYIALPGINNCIIMEGGFLRITGRIAEEYANSTNAVTGDGFIAKVQEGTLFLHDFEGRNPLGGCVWLGPLGVLITNSVILEAGFLTGGAPQPAVDGMGTLTCSGQLNTNSATAITVIENIAVNHTVDPAVVII